jgi:hypothetical protein
MRVASLAAAGLLSVGLAPAPAAAQSPATLATFDTYVQLTDARVAAATRDASRFLWIDTLTEARRVSILKTLHEGDVVVERTETRDRGKEIDVPGGMLHHWVGTVFVPQVPVGRAVALMQDYNRHGEIFAPVITQARLVSQSGDDFTFTMRFVIRKVISATLNTDQQAHFERPSPDRAWSRIITTRTAEMDDAGTPAEREKPTGQDHGYLWQLVSYWHYLERDGGTFIQCESVSLSRPLPMGIRWLLGRAAASVPRDITAANLASARRHLLQ